MREVNEIILHCSATKEGQDFKAKDIDAWHKQRGYSKIGYHYVIQLNGVIEKGRDDNAIGAHCLGHNERSIGVCYVGGLDRWGKAKDTRTPEQKSALLKLVTDLKAKYPGATVHGHNEFANKHCPCFTVKNEFV